MASVAATKDENPKISTDLNLAPPSIEVASTTQQPPASDAGCDESKGELAPTETAEKTSAVEGGGAATDIQKKTKRAERFGLTVVLSEEEKRNSRAERFGAGPALNGSDSSKQSIVSPKQSKDKQSEELKRKARGERFGVVKSTTADEEVKKKARLSRFGSSPPTDPAEEEKMKARTLRFSQPDSNSKTNGESDNKANITVASKAGGGT